MDLYINKIKILKDFRGLKKNTIINIKKPILVLVGKNGCGKSTILDGLRVNFGINDISLLKNDTALIDLLSIEPEYAPNIIYRDAANEDFRHMASGLSPDISIQISQFKTSSGQRNLMGFINLNPLGIRDSLVIFDEPEVSMDHIMQKKIGAYIKNTCDISQYIIASHSYLLIEQCSRMKGKFDIESLQIFDMDKWKTISITDYFDKYFEEK